MPTDVEPGPGDGEGAELGLDLRFPYLVAAVVEGRGSRRYGRLRGSPCRTRPRESGYGTSRNVIGADDLLLQAADEVVHVMQPIFLDVEGMATEAGALGEQDALGPGRGDVDQGADAEGTTSELDGQPLGDRCRARAVDVAVPFGGELRPRGAEDFDRRAVVQREGAVRARFGEPDADQFPQLVGVLGRQVVRLRAIGVGVVELPVVVVEVAPPRWPGGSSPPSSPRARPPASRAWSRTACSGPTELRPLRCWTAC